MIRLISGQWRNLSLFSPEDKAIRPTSERSREAVFNILAYPKRSLPLIGPWPELRQARFLDGFCGSGSVGLEALSRGVKSSYFLDKHRQSIQLAQQNYRHCQQKSPLDDADKPVFLCQDLTRPGPCQQAAVDIAFLDPPYGKNLLAPSLKALSQNGWLRPHAIVIAEGSQQDIDYFSADMSDRLIFTLPADETTDMPEMREELPFALLEKRKYGKAHFMILQAYPEDEVPDDAR